MEGDPVSLSFDIDVAAAGVAYEEAQRPKGLDSQDFPDPEDLEEFFASLPEDSAVRRSAEMMKRLSAERSSG